MLPSSWGGGYAQRARGHRARRSVTSGKSKIAQMVRYALTRRDAPRKTINGGSPPRSAPRFMISLTPGNIRILPAD